MKINNISFDSGLKSTGIPKLYIHNRSNFKIGKNFKINNIAASNPIGRNAQCMFVVRENAFLYIGQNVGMSGVTIVCQKKITIKDNVKIGGNVCIYDTDFHSLDKNNRKNQVMDNANTIRKDIFIDDNAFIGAHTTILKGVYIGKNSIIGACSVVTKRIPKNEIWAGNPAKFIRKIEHEDK